MNFWDDRERIDEPIADAPLNLAGHSKRSLADRQHPDARCTRDQLANTFGAVATAIHRAADEPGGIDRRDCSAINLFEIGACGPL